MSVAYQLTVLLVGAEPGIHAVVIGGGVSVVRTALHVVLQHRVEPDGGYAQVGKVIQTVGNTFQVAAVAGIGVVAVHLVGHPHSNLVVIGIAVGKPVRHDQVEHVGRVETLYVQPFRVSRFEFVVMGNFPLSVGKNDFELLRSTVGNIQVQNPVVGAFQRNRLFQVHPFCRDRGLIRCDVLAGDHQLQLGFLHAAPPESGFDLYLLGLQRTGQRQEQGEKCCPFHSVYCIKSVSLTQML